MNYLTAERFTFASQALASDALGVVSFKGTEGFSSCYRFEIDLVSSDLEIDAGQVLKRPAVFTIKREDGDVPFHGILSEWRQMQAYGEYAFYRTVLQPRLWWLTLTSHNQVFLDKTIPEVISGALKDGGLNENDFELRPTGNYPSWEYVCQYNESHFDFVSRWMERDGLYYFFEQSESGEKVIITDTKLSHQDSSLGREVVYSPPSGLEILHQQEVVRGFSCRYQIVPQSVQIKDYNYRQPSMDLACQAEVPGQGFGEVYIYGEHYKTKEEGQQLAGIRSEAIQCRRKTFHGESTVPYLQTGYTFTLTDHFRSDFNRDYLTTAVEHQGQQTGYLVSGLKEGLTDADREPHYLNRFTAIPSDVQFRAPRTTPPSQGVRGPQRPSGRVRDRPVRGTGWRGPLQGQTPL